MSEETQTGVKREEVSPRGQRNPSQESRDKRFQSGVRGAPTRSQEVSFQELGQLLSRCQENPYPEPRSGLCSRVL